MLQKGNAFLFVTKSGPIRNNKDPIRNITVFFVTFESKKGLFRNVTVFFVTF